MENQGTNEDDSQSDPHPEAGIFFGQTTQNSDLEECCDSFVFKPIGSNQLKLAEIISNFFHRIQNASPETSCILLEPTVDDIFSFSKNFGNI